MKKFGKVLASLMVPVIALSITGFSSAGFAANKSGKLTTLSSKVEKDPETGLPMLADRNKPITFNIFIRDPAMAPSKNNPVLKKITQLTGVTINFEFLVGDLQQKQGVMIAGEDYPDAIFAESQKFIDAGAFIPIEDKLKKYSNLEALYAPFKKIMTQKDGHEYILELYGAKHKSAPTFEDGGVGFFIQKAVLAEGGYKTPKTLDQYFKLIENYKAKHPTINGVNTIGFEVLSDGWRDFCLRNPAQHLMGAGNDGDVYVDTKTYTASYYQISDTAKNYYKKLNEEYNKGIIQAETFTESYDQYISRLSTGAVLGMFDQAWDFQNATNALKTDKKYDRTYVAVPIANPGVKDSYLDAPTNSFTGNNGLGITKKCKDPDRLLEFYNWIVQQDVQNYLQWGVAGKDYKVVGKDKVVTPARRAIINDTAKKRDLTGDTLWNYSPKQQGLYPDGTPCGSLDSVADYKASLSAYDQKFLSAFKIDYPAQLLSKPAVRAAYYPVWSLPLEDGSPAKVSNTAMNDIIRKYYPRLIMANPADYNGLWNTFLGDFKSGNVQPYLDEVNKLIKDKMAK